MTHDAKRSADARARVVALTWFPDEWLALVRRWITFASPDPALTEPDPIDRYFILQTLIGVWPIEWERIDGYLEKALRESKRHSNWIEPDLAYEDGAKAWARALMEHGDFHVEFRRLLAAVEHLGYAISTAWIALKILCPGVPDIYQGDELAYRALVDPDNRRPVDWDARAAALADRGGADIKMSTILSLLELRRAHPDAFGPHGTYRAIDLGDAAIGFGRGDAVEVRIGLSATSGFSVQVHETL